MIGSYGSKIGKEQTCVERAHRNDLFGKKTVLVSPFEKIDAETAKPGNRKQKTYHLLGAVAFVSHSVFGNVFVYFSLNGKNIVRHVKIYL